MANRKARLALAAALLLAVGAVAWMAGLSRGRAELGPALEAGFQRSFFSYVDHVVRLETLLAKALVSSSPGQQVLLLTRGRDEAESAQESLASLPVGIDLLDSQRLLTQTGDFAYSLATRIAQGEMPGAEQWRTLTSLHARVADMAERLVAIQQEALRGGFRWTEVERRLSRVSGADALPAATPLTRRGAGSAPGVGDSLADMDRELQEVPALIYDGPFSAHQVDRKPAEPLGDEVSREEAERRARSFLGGRLRLLGRSEMGGTLPAWIFTFRRLEPGPEPLGGQAGEQIAVTVSRAGGRVLWVLSEREPGGVRIAPRAALDRAARLLEERGFRGFTATGWVREGETLTASFAPRVPISALVRGDAGAVDPDTPVVVYPDLVKVTVALDDGSVLGFDARTYWLSRHRRQLPAPRLDPEQARATTNPALDVASVRLAVVPLPSGREVLAYEVLGTFGRDRFLTYLNAGDGREELLLRLVETADARITQ